MTSEPARRYRMPLIDLNRLDLTTATDVIDLLSDSLAERIVLERFEAGLPLTDEILAERLSTAMEWALPELLRRLDRDRPGLGGRVARHFAAEHCLGTR